MDNPAGIFISYSHENSFEAVTLTHELSKIGCQCWIDFKGITGGDVWRESIEQGLQQSLVTIVILTPESINSKWVLYEVGRATYCRHIIIPIMFRPCSLPSALERYQYIDFTKGPDYEKLFQSVVIGITRRMRSDVISRGLYSAQPEEVADQPNQQAVLPPPVENLRLERPDGTVRTESLFYVKRQGDRVIERELSGEGSTIVIKAPRQVGKSSMLIHAIGKVDAIGKKVALLDFQSLDTLNNQTVFYQDFCSLIAKKLGLENQTLDVWNRFQSNTLACTVYMEEYVLGKLTLPLVLAIDEVDRMFDCPFRSDFFGMLRSWHNLRGSINVWRKLDMILVISTEPYMLIENSAQSPFNVGEVIELEDFSTRNVQDLNERHGKPFSESELNDLYAITSGHPYLIRQALYRVAISEISPAEILDTSTYTRGNGGIFKDHLHRYRSYFQNQPNLRQKMQGIIQQDVDLSDDEFYRLRSAGLVMINEDQQVLPRCKLYELYFGAKLK